MKGRIVKLQDQNPGEHLHTKKIQENLGFLKEATKVLTIIIDKLYPILNYNKDVWWEFGL